MNWPDFLQAARVRAIEESGGAAEEWSPDAQREVARRSAQNRKARDEGFLLDRANLLLLHARDRTACRALAVPSLPWFVVAAGWAAAAIIGAQFSALGQDREVNILSLPLITIIAWNLVVFVISVVHGIRKAGSGAAPRWLVALHDRFPPGDGKAAARAAQGPRRARFREIAWPTALERLSFRFRAWLHIAAALFAFGAVAGMYQRGWSRDYRAVWESTLLDEESARSFFAALFSPASRFTGVPVPLEALPAMHRTAAAAAQQPAPALPWIDLYGATLGLFVILPRLALAILEKLRADRVITQHLRGAGWREYIARIRESADLSGAPVCVLVHGLTLDDASRDRWRRFARVRWRDLGPLECRSIPVGGEAEFMAALDAPIARTMLVFNESSTPEAEVHRALAESLLARLRGVKHFTPPMLIALDDHDLKKRWAGFADGEERLAARRAAWRDVVRGLEVEWAQGDDR